MKLSPILTSSIYQFLTRLFSGELNHLEALAVALDRLSDLVWEEVEAQELIPPSMRLD